MHLRKTTGIPPRIAFLLSKTEFLLEFRNKIESKHMVDRIQAYLMIYLTNNISSPSAMNDVTVAPCKCTVTLFFSSIENSMILSVIFIS